MGHLIGISVGIVLISMGTCIYRSQSVKASNAEVAYINSSECLCKQFSKYFIRFGVPQVSELEPVSFLLFLNDLPSNLPASNLYLFADDTSLVVSRPDRLHLKFETFIQSDSVLKRLSDNSLHVNAQKATFLNSYKATLGFWH